MADYAIPRADLDLESLPPTPCTYSGQRRAFADATFEMLSYMEQPMPTSDDPLLDDILLTTCSCEPSPKRARLTEDLFVSAADNNACMTVPFPLPMPSTPTSQGSSPESPLNSPVRCELNELLSSSESETEPGESSPASAGSTPCSSPTSGNPSPSTSAAAGEDEEEASGADGQKPKQGRRTTLPWSAEEDQKLLQAVEELGPKRWSAVASCVGTRSGKQCRLRWCNQIDPSIKREAWSEEEDTIILRERMRPIPTPWVAIAAILVGRPDNAIKNRWNSTLRRRQQQATPTEPLALA